MMDKTNVMSSDIELTSLNPGIENNHDLAHIDDRYVIKVEAQLENLEDIKVRDASIKARITTKEKVIDTIKTVIRFASFFIVVASLVSPFLLFVIIAISMIGASAFTIVLMTVTCISVPASIMTANDYFSFFRNKGTSENDIYLKELEEIYHYFFFRAPDNKTYFYFFWMLMNLKKLEDVNTDPNISKHIKKYMLKCKKPLIQSMLPE
ncbi:MAG: hypothetical protein KAG53_10385 [Endozoicomonadaceae bacterium]|nr:hypothetical protein [Endozoicomonadaceae bacterium]